MNKKRDRKKKILIIAATHGDERLGVDAVKKLKIEKLKYDFDYIIGNPRAFRTNKRYIDSDLNRIYPGKSDSKNYEEKQAYKNMQIASGYEYVIDVHEAKNSNESFIVIPSKKISNKKADIASGIALKKIVLWPSTTKRRTGPIAQFVDNSIEIEFGSKGTTKDEMLEYAGKILSDLILRLMAKKLNRKKKSFYLVYEKVINDNYKLKSQEDFSMNRNNNEIFYPLFYNQYCKDGISFYKMKLVKDVVI